MNISKLALALVSSMALPLAALAAGGSSYGSDRGAQGSQAGSSQQQYGGGMQSGTQSGTTQSDTGMGRSGAMDPSTTGTTRGRTGAEGSAGLPMFDSLDRNKDGMISKAEARKSTMANRNFRTLDSDRDGKLSRDEWTAGGGQMGSDMGSGTGTTQ